MASVGSYGSQQIAAYGTHLPWLAACVVNTSGPVVEFGSGDYSTNFLHCLCGSLGRELWTIENDCEWVKRYTGDLQCSWHKFILEDPRLADVPHCGVALIDCCPDAVRPIVLNLHADNADILICHDTESQEYGWDFSGFKYAKHCLRLFPFTTACSNTNDLSFLDLPGNVADGIKFNGRTVVCACQSKMHEFTVPE